MRLPLIISPGTCGLVLPLPLLLFCVMARAGSSFALRSGVGMGKGDGDGPVITSNVPLNEINIHVFRHFRKRYPRVFGEAWLKTEEEYIISFMDNAQRHQAHYNLRGGFLYDVKYYAGEEIPAEAGNPIAKQYPGYRIGVVTEITDGDRIFWLVKIENPSFVKTVSVCDGKLELVEDLVNGG